VLYYVAKYGRVGDAVVAVAPAILIPISTSAYVSAAIASKLTPRKRVRLPFTEEQMKRAMENQDREVLKHIKDPELALRDTTIRLLYEIWKASRGFWKYAKNINIITKGLDIDLLIPRSTNIQLTHEFTPELTDPRNSVN
jgi:hypothetical protein